MMKKYDAYKDSGVKWIGEIPNHWEGDKDITCTSNNRKWYNAIILA